MLDHIHAPAFFLDVGLEAATNLVTSEVTHRSFRATWTAPGSPVDTYRITYMMVDGGPTEEVRERMNVNSQSVRSLCSGSGGRGVPDLVGIEGWGGEALYKKLFSANYRQCHNVAHTITSIQFTYYYC